jgi:predicted adenine nucleotide alpha hydrolase (AANH) superfamily ATPase
VRSRGNLRERSEMRIDEDDITDFFNEWFPGYLADMSTPSLKRYYKKVERKLRKMAKNNVILEFAIGMYKELDETYSETIKEIQAHEEAHPECRIRYDYHTDGYVSLAFDLLERLSSSSSLYPDKESA